VHVGIAVPGSVEVDHVRDAVHVDAAGRDVGGHERVHVARLEARERLLALGLRLVAVHRHGRHGVLAQALDQPVGAALGAHEDQRAAALGITELVHQRAHLCVVLEMDEAVRHGHLVLGPGRMHVALGVPCVCLGHAAGLALERGGEEERLALLGDLGHDPVDSGLEAHVEHPVGLVEHEHLHVLQGQVAPLEQVLQATGGRDDDVRPRSQPGLLLEADTAVHHGNGQGAGGGDAVDLVHDLSRQLSRGSRDQARGPARVGRDAVDHRHPEGEGLTRACG
jgi:hypothetical protein